MSITSDIRNYADTALEQGKSAVNQVVGQAQTAVDGRPSLRYSHRDAQSVAEVLKQAGRFATADVAVLHADARTADLPDRIDGLVTSPPYPGLIDYHEQHRYAYELLGLDDRREREIGAGESGTSLAAREAYRKVVMVPLQ